MTCKYTVNILKVVKLCSFKRFKLCLADARQNNLLRLQMHYFHAIKYISLYPNNFICYISSHIHIVIFTGTDVSGFLKLKIGNTDEIGNTQ